MAATHLSEHFSIEEFACPCCAGATVNGKIIAALEKLRTLLGDKPIRVHSGYRCGRHNLAVGGKSNSRHLSGEAADISVAGMTAERLLQVVEHSCLFGGIGVYGDGHVHVDVRAEHAEWRVGTAA